METIKEEQITLDETTIDMEAPAQNKPAIDHLPDAIVKNEMGTLVLLVKPGEKLIIERCASILAGKPWLDTKTYIVMSIDEATGAVALWDDDLHRYAGTNYVSGYKAGYRFKMSTKAAVDIGKKKRGRPRKNPPVEAKPVEVDDKGQPVKKKRGRPAGVKNRPKDVIATEKAAVRKLRAEKAAKRSSKRAMKVALSSAPVEVVLPAPVKSEPKVKSIAKTKKVAKVEKAKKTEKVSKTSKVSKAAKTKKPAKAKPVKAAKKPIAKKTKVKTATKAKARK